MASLANESETLSRLDNLSYPLLLHILSFLTARELIKASKVKLSFFILSKILYARTPSWKTSFGTCKGSKTDITGEELDECVRGLMDRSTSFPNFGILFGEAGKFDESTGESLSRVLSPDAVLIGGCVSALASVNTDCSEDKAVNETDTSRSQFPRYSLSLACMPETQRKAFFVSKDVLEDTEEALSCVPSPDASESKDSGDWKVVILLVDQYSSGAGLHEFIQGIQEKCPSAEVVGGILGGGASNMIVVENRKCTYYEKGIVGLCLGGRVVFNSQVSRACKPMCEDCRILESQGRILKTVSTKSGEVEMSGYNMAMQAMQSMGGRRQAVFFGISDDLEKGYTLHNLAGATQEGYLVLTTDEFKEGDYCRMFLLDPDATREDLQLRLEAAKEKCKAQSKTVLGGLLFTCGGRGYRFYKEKAVESTLFKNAMPDNVGLSGFFAGGEIGPEALAMQNVNNDFRNKAAIQGFTAVYGVFFVPKDFTPSGKILEVAMETRNLSF